MYEDVREKRQGDDGPIEGYTHRSGYVSCPLFVEVSIVPIIHSLAILSPVFRRPTRQAENAYIIRRKALLCKNYLEKFLDPSKWLSKAL